MSEQSTTILTGFVENFLDAGFNPLFIAIRKLIEQDVDRLFDCHRMHYLFLVGWFLEAEILRRKRQKSHGKGNESFGLVGAALHQNNFVVLMKLMKESFERGEKQNFDVLYASMICFTQILHVVSEMETTGSEDDKEIAENMKLRLFYEEESLDVLAQLPKIAFKEPEPFLKAAIELNHMLLKMLDKFSKQHTAVFIKSKRRKRARRKAAKKTTNEGDNDNEIKLDYDDEDGDVEEAEVEAERVTKELKFEFSKFETKFINEETMDTYKRFFYNYNELTPQEIKWVLTFFHRIFVKREVHSLLFGLDFMRLLDMVLSSRDGLPPNHKSRPEVENFCRFYMAKLTSALSRTPSLYVELLFSKLSEHVHYLDHGYDEVKKSHQYKFSAVMQFYDEAANFPEDKRFAIVIAALLDDDKLSLVEWLTERLSEIVEEFRKAHAARDGEMHGFMQELTTDDTDKRTSMNKDGKFRLLLDMIGFDVPYLNHERCILPGTVPISKIETSIRYLKIYMMETVDLDGRFAAEFLKNPQAKVKRDRYETDSGIDQDESSSDDGMDAFNDSRFAALPEEERERRKRKKAKGKSTSRKKRQVQSKKDEQAAANRKRREHEEMRNIKSSMDISPSDDESDEERDRAFFESEARLRAKLAAQLGDKGTKIPDKEVADNLYRELNERWRNNADAVDDDDDLAPSASPEPPAVSLSTKNNTTTNGNADDDDDLELSSDDEDNHPNGTNPPQFGDDNEKSLFVSDNENDAPKQKRRPRMIALSDDDD